MAVTSIILSSLSTLTSSACSSDTRIRRPWHDLSDEDQLLYVRGFHRLRRQGTLVLFLESHDNANVNYHVHESAQNFYWHSYWLFELENSFRDLGREWECFTLPYWDVTHDEEYWSGTDSPQIGDLPIFNAHLGGDGNVNNNFCVEDEPWSVDYYTTEYLCADDEESPNCCLKRFHSDSNGSSLASREEMSDVIYLDKQYASFENFSIALNDHHSNIHTFIGSVEGKTHFNPVTGEPEVDPLFPLFHAFIEYVRLMRQDCYEYDKMAATEWDSWLGYVYGNNANMTLDYNMTFSVLCDGSNGQRVRMCSSAQITPRLMMDISPNSPFNIVYELGNFWNKGLALPGFCSDNLNSTWWSNADATSSTSSQFVMDRVLSSVAALSGETSFVAMAVMVMGLVVIAVLRSCRSSSKGKGQWIASTEAVDYGTV